MTMQPVLLRYAFPVLLSVLAGCTNQLPSMSHAHIGHSLTAWRDTPGEQALFVVAEREVETALNEAQAAREASRQPAVARQHLRNVMHALNPDRQPTGTGSGYGAIRALQGSIDHIEFAASTEDASENVVNSSAVFAEHGQALLVHLRDTAELTQQAMTATPATFDTDLDIVVTRIEHAAHGTDLDADGHGGSHPSESGLKQLRAQLGDMLDAESPAYAPVGRKYLFGLVRLPNGDWAYRFDRSGTPGSGGDGY